MNADSLLGLVRPGLSGPRSARSSLFADCSVFFIALGICVALLSGEQSAAVSWRKFELPTAERPSVNRRESARLTPVLNLQADGTTATRLLLFGDPHVLLAENLARHLFELGDGGRLEIVDRRGAGSLLTGALAEVAEESQSVERVSTIAVFLRSQRSRPPTPAASPSQESAVADELLASKILASYGISHGVFELSSELVAAETLGFWLMRFGWGAGDRSVRPYVLQL